MVAEMLRIPIMTEEPKKFKQVLPMKFVTDAISISLDPAELIPVSIGNRLVSQVSLNELGKQLLKAAGEGNLDEVKSLMSKGAPFSADWLGTTPLHIAAQNNHLDICEILLRAGISRDARTKVDRTPLHMAVYEGHLKIVETLLANGADCDCKDLLLMTPLHWAAQNGHANIAALLVRYGATTDAVNKFNLTPSDIARQMNREDIVQVIENGDRDPCLASHHLSVQLAEECNSDSNVSNVDGDLQDAADASEVICTPVEVLMEDDPEEASQPTNTKNSSESNDTTDYCTDPQQTSLSESLKLLQRHGITMLPAEDQNILSSAVESGHSVVLTDVGKEVLNSVKISEEQDQNETRKYLTITPEELFALTSTDEVSQLKQVSNGKTSPSVKPSIKRVVMKKNRINPMNGKSSKSDRVPTDMELVMKQLIEAKKVIEEYKVKLMKKEAEAEKYKQQLKIMMDSK